MSQEKVDRYKKEKANRVQLQKKEKRVQFFEKFVFGVVGVVLVGWIGYSAYGVVTRPSEDAAQKTVTTEIDINALDKYLGELNGVGEE